MTDTNTLATEVVAAAALSAGLTPGGHAPHLTLTYNLKSQTWRAGIRVVSAAAKIKGRAFLEAVEKSPDEAVRALHVKLHSGQQR
jgi:hypothetical protein